MHQESRLEIITFPEVIGELAEGTLSSSVEQVGKLAQGILAFENLRSISPPFGINKLDRAGHFLTHEVGAGQVTVVNPATLDGQIRTEPADDGQKTVDLVGQGESPAISPVVGARNLLTRIWTLLITTGFDYKDLV